MPKMNRKRHKKPARTSWNQKKHTRKWPNQHDESNWNGSSWWNRLTRNYTRRPNKGIGLTQLGELAWQSLSGLDWRLVGLDPNHKLIPRWIWVGLCWRLAGLGPNWNIDILFLDYKQIGLNNGYPYLESRTMSTWNQTTFFSKTCQRYSDYVSDRYNNSERVICWSQFFNHTISIANTIVTKITKTPLHSTPNTKDGIDHYKDHRSHQPTTLSDFSKQGSA